jgi:hypothetical protein
MVACIVLVIFNGIPPFLEDPFDVRMFIASYIGVSFSRSDNASYHHLTNSDPSVRPSNLGVQDSQAWI